MKNNTFGLLTSCAVFTCLTVTGGCAEQTQNLQTINRALGNAQKTVDYANTAVQAPQATTEALKKAGKAAVEQNPALNEAAQTVKSTKTLIKSVKDIGKTASE